MKRATLLPLLALTCLAWLAPVAYAQEAPDALVKRVAEDMLQTIRSDKELQAGNQAKVKQVIETKLVPHFDFVRMTSLAMGRNWRTATAEQQQQVQEQFKLLLIRTYSGALAQLKPDQQIQYPPFRADPADTDVVVKTVALNNGQPVQIDYRLYKTSNGWKVYDLNVLGAWLIQTYQQQFNEKIQQSGVDGLIKFLTQRNQELAAGKQAS